MKYSYHDEWWVDVYGDSITKAPTRYHQYMQIISTQPRLFPTVEAYLNMLNPFIVLTLKDLLKGHYDETQHFISFSIDGQRTILKLGTQITCELNDNLTKLFGFSSKTFTESYTHSMESPMTLDKREQHLFIQSDLIAPISFGEQKEYILRDFIHSKAASYGIVEKIFEPILFHPVVKQNIPIISMKVTNGLRKCIHLKDTKTLITLIFRKSK